MTIAADTAPLISVADPATARSCRSVRRAWRSSSVGVDGRRLARCGVQPRQRALAARMPNTPVGAGHELRLAEPGGSHRQDAAQGVTNLAGKSVALSAIFVPPARRYGMA
ncbi:hypothetical protein M8494_20315 [Serratia ureilytica]